MRESFARLAPLLLGLAFTNPAFAAGMSEDDYQAKIKSYDPAAVTAATDYAKTFDVMEPFQRTAPQMASSLQKRLKDKNPELTDDQIKTFVDTFEHSALVEHADEINQAVVLGLLETFTGEELAALDKFYQNPVGASILKKYPTVGQKINDARRLMSTDIVPKAMEAAIAKLKSQGVNDVKM